MAGATLTMATQMQCPHGGVVVIVPANTRALSQGSPILTSADSATVVGCVFNVAGAPSPCVGVRWMVTDVQAAAGAPTLSAASTGFCVNAAGAPQGPVSVSGGSPGLATR